MKRNIANYTKKWMLMPKCGVILKAGKTAGSNAEKRLKNNMTNEDCDPPSLYALWKDHKQSNDDKSPPFWPMCGAMNAHNSQLSHLLSSIVKEIDKTYSFKNIEHLMYGIENVNLDNHVRKFTSVLWM